MHIYTWDGYDEWVNSVVLYLRITNPISREVYACFIIIVNWCSASSPFHRFIVHPISSLEK